MDRIEPPHSRRPRPLSLVARAIASGSFAGLATTAAVALCGARQAGSAAAPINATTHVLWGDEARTADTVDVKHTVPGLLINAGAGVFWALVHELVLGRWKNHDRATAAATGAAVAGLAYVVDYHLIPRRLTPGWELRLPPRSVALGFVALGAALAVAGFFRARR
jgi:hypothetical protein